MPLVATVLMHALPTSTVNVCVTCVTISQRVTNAARLSTVNVMSSYVSAPGPGVRLRTVALPLSEPKEYLRS